MVYHKSPRLFVGCLVVCVIILVMICAVVRKSRTIYDRPMDMQVEIATEYIRDAIVSAAAFYQQKGRMPKSLHELFPHSLLDGRDWEGDDYFAPWSLMVVDGLRPLKFKCRGKTLVVYSIGPDRLDDLGKVTYDPTNGICSRGDIVGLLRIP
jgi:hypothetical protein